MLAGLFSKDWRKSRELVIRFQISSASVSGKGE